MELFCGWSCFPARIDIHVELFSIWNFSLFSAGIILQLECFPYGLIFQVDLLSMCNCSLSSLLVLLGEWGSNHSVLFPQSSLSLPSVFSQSSLSLISVFSKSSLVFSPTTGFPKISSQLGSFLVSLYFFKKILESNSSLTIFSDVFSEKNNYYVEGK